MKILRLIVLVALVTANAVGCAHVQRRDSRDAPWDPQGHGQLMDQMPNWDGAAGKVCCGHLRSCGPGQTPKC